MADKYELQDKNNPHVRITVSDPKSVRELEANGWQRIQATVTKAGDGSSGKGAKQS